MSKSGIVPDMQTTDLITSPEASIILQVSHRTVHRMVAAGDLTPVRQLPGPNGAFLYDRAQVEALAAQRAARDTNARRAS